MPKTLNFAQDDAHAEEVVTTVREVFGKGNDFAAKITYDARDPKSTRSIIAAMADPFALSDELIDGPRLAQPRVDYEVGVQAEQRGLAFSMCTSTTPATGVLSGKSSFMSSTLC